PSPSSLASFYVMSSFPPRSTLFPYTTLFRSGGERSGAENHSPPAMQSKRLRNPSCLEGRSGRKWRDGKQAGDRRHSRGLRQEREDRKSTRLNSSHSQISYAVFCLKKKKKCTN